MSNELAIPERAVTLRLYPVEDHDPLARLAALDSSTPPHQPVVYVRQLDVHPETRARADCRAVRPTCCALKAGCRDVHPIGRS
jgi:hypothetical protein